MACALLSDSLKLYIKAGETRMSVLMGGNPDTTRAMSRSALQNPELNRYELDCLLRRSPDQPSRAFGWTSFFAGTSAACANSNAEIA